MSATLEEDQWQYGLPKEILNQVLTLWLGCFVRFLQDDDMHYKENNVYAMARTSNLNEELGQVRAPSGLDNEIGASEKVDPGEVCAKFKCQIQTQTIVNLTPTWSFKSIICSKYG